MILVDVRCKCGKLLGKIDGSYEIKCKSCKRIHGGTTTIKKQYTPIKETITNE